MYAWRGCKRHALVGVAGGVVMESAYTWLGPNGKFQSTWARYQPRSVQLEMAQAVERALENEQVLFCEAGTGTGKTLAYLIPALLSGRRVVISTATRALQDQIWNTDLPLLERVLGKRIRAALMKGLTNYLCLRRAQLAHQQHDLTHHSALRIIEQWQETTNTGDFAELSELHERDPVLALVQASSETRIGAPCPFFDRCFVTNMRREAEGAQLLIVNHHLFFADLALRGAHPGRVLPDYDAVVLDEAHQVEDTAALFFGTRLSERRVRTLLKDASALLEMVDAPTNLISQVERGSKRLFESVANEHPGEQRVMLRPDVWGGGAYQSYLDLDSVLEALAAATVSARQQGVEERDAREGLDALIRRTQDVRNALAFIVEGDRRHVTWLDRSEGGRALSATPVDVGPILRERLFHGGKAVILTSATLATPEAPLRALGSDDNAPPDHDSPRSRFSFARTRLGAISLSQPVEELVLDSPFDFKKNALLYIAKDLPEPQEHEFAEQALPQIVALVTAAQGSCFLLTTSFRVLQQLHGRLKLGWSEMAWEGGTPRLLVQGEAPKTQLLDTFRLERNAVLIATMGFWEGVDVPGDALRLVIIDKIPFSVPTDPLVRARVHHLEEQHRNAFSELFIPSAQMALKQGFGRLIRSEADRGVVAVLDSRLHRKGYGQRILSALPPARRTTRLVDAVAFLKQGAPANGN
jgi:ATP-dependent DNA helicase DinG